jgi:hypothetical protein
LRISQPSGYEFDEFTDLSGFDVSGPDAFGTVVHTRSGLSDDVRITVGMSNDDRLVSRPLAVEGVDIELRSWPDDPEWADFAAAKVEAGIPALEDLIGVAWPVEGSFAVRQTVEPSLSGYAGWFDAASNEIAVGEARDADTIYHELSHAWINSRLSTERWLTEGLAQVYAAELVRRDGDDARSPSEPDVDDPAALPLTGWGGLGSERAVEEFGYATSFWVVDALVDDIGFDRTAEVIAALRSGASPYDEASPVERPDADWKRVYDVFVEIGGADVTGKLFGAHVVDADGATAIERRDRAAIDVAELAERSSPWELPIGVRHRLERWEIDDVIEATIDAELVLERRSELEAIEAAVGLDEPDLAGAAYATSAMRASGGVDFTEAAGILDAAIGTGVQLEERVASVAVLASDAGATPPRLSAVAGVEDFAAGLAAADAQIRALDRIVEIQNLLDATSGLTVTVGRWGSDIEGDLDEARAHVEQGDNEAALVALASAEDHIDGLAAAGTMRLALGGAVLVALLVALLVAVWLRRRRTHGVAAESTNEVQPSAR